MKRFSFVVLLLLTAPLALAGFHYTGSGFGYTANVYLRNVSAVALSNGTLVPASDSYQYIVHVSFPVPAQLIGFYANFSTPGKIYGVVCSVENEFGSYSSDGIVYRISSGYVASCDFRETYNEGAGPFYDPSIPRFKMVKDFAVSMKFFVPPNASLNVTGVVAFLYRSSTPTDFVILKTAGGYDLRVEPVRFSYLALRTLTSRDAVIELLGSKNPSDYLNLTFNTCNWSESGRVLLQFFSADPRFHTGGRYLLVEPSDCGNVSFPDFKRRWVVFEGLHVKSLSEIRGVFITGTVYEAPTDDWELRYWGMRIISGFLLGVVVGLFLGWRKWKGT
ncbi:hypothetical protein [Thermococcus sp.]|uniref:hypothetical protein n=1 Tax=Thermococcus sp. TaxID=35749 RepID=UPI002615E0F1|nr:hypothetical protein [Thermococcus sp.]